LRWNRRSFFTVSCLALLGDTISQIQSGAIVTGVPVGR
jgi:hypothetical protein